MIKPLFVILFLFTSLKPSPPGIALNPDTRECGYYFSEEYVKYILPPPWEINYGTPIKTETGTHQWDGNYDSIESFCRELGYKYIPGNLGVLFGHRKFVGFGKLFQVYELTPLFLIFVALVFGILIIAKRIKRINSK